MTGGPSMSERWGQDGTTAFAEQPAANDGVTAGALLRRAREASGLHVAALAVSLKVPVRKLEALEDNRWDLLPDAVFVRALASSVCRTLKIDPQPVLERLPQTSAPRLVQDGDGINTPFRAPSDGVGPTWSDQLSRPVFLVVFALLLGALALILLPARQQEASVTTVTGPDTAVSVSPAGPGPAPTTAPAEVAPPLAPVAPAPAASSVVAVAPVLTPSAAVPAAPAAPAAPVSGTIVFRAKEASWIEVTDAKGVVAVRRLLGAGEAAGASGAPPLQVIVGRADATEVQVRGKPFDLKPVSKDNVARFEVK
jgi:cytoskeleton protein RodZ